MPFVKPFALDRWIGKHRHLCKTFLHDSCVNPFTLAELRALASTLPDLDALPESSVPFDESMPLSYGTIRGSNNLRRLVADLYVSSSLSADDVLVTSGAISANFLLLDSFCNPGDHVICQYPTYGQLIELPRRAGAEVTLWRMKEEQGWGLDVNDLRALVKENTKMIIINNPSNPTGSVLSRTLLEEIVTLAREYDILVFSDEVFRPLFHMNEPPPPSLLDIGYENSIVAGSMSKAYALPGIRIGWLAAHTSLRHTILRRAEEERDYTSISVSQIDDQIAAFALQPAVRAKVLQRSAAIVERNIRVLEEWVGRHPEHVRWTKPKGAGTCVVTILDGQGKAVDDEAFAAALAKEEAVLSPPAHVCFGHEGPEDLKGGLRVGVVMKEGILEEGLAGLDRLLSRMGLHG